MVLCFFSLSTAMSANLMEQVKEISVLRAIGNSRSALTLLYIYESFVLVLSSSLIGLFVGYCIGFTMALQQTLIT
jgi:ABC-type antimicrobial peptide transport system permease subunit